MSLEKSVFFFFYLQWFKVTECLDSLCPKRHGESQPSAAATLTHLTKWTWVFGREFHQLLQYSEIWQSFTGASKNTLSRAPSDSVSVQDAGMMRGPQVQLWVCVFMYICVYVCVCQSMSSWSRGSFSPAEVLDEAPPSRLFLCVRTEERGRYKVFRGRKQEFIF